MNGVIDVKVKVEYTLRGTVEVELPSDYSLDFNHINAAYVLDDIVDDLLLDNIVRCEDYIDGDAIEVVSIAGANSGTVLWQDK